MEESAIPPLLGIIGYEIAGNPTQFAMERVLGAANLEWRFLSFAVEPDRLADAIRGLDALGFRGLAVAPSCSASVVTLLEEKAVSCHMSGWTDVIVRAADGKLVGHNIIAQGLVDWFGKALVSDATAIVLGDTGKSLAMSRLLIGHGAEQICLRDVKQLDEHSGFRYGALTPDDWATCKILIRASTGDEKLDAAAVSEAELDLLPLGCAVIDLATYAGTSPLLRYSAARGLRILSAIDLMVIRSSTAFQMWTGKQPDVSLLREAFEEYLEI